MILYQEKSRLSKSSSLSALFSLLPIIFFYTQDKSPEALYFLIGIASIIISIFLLLLFSALTIKVYSDKILYKFFPLERKFKEIKFSDVEKIGFTNVDPIHDFGGIWGIRKSKKYGTGYIINGGSRGIFVKSKTEDKFFFTVKDTEKLKSILKDLPIEF